MTRREHMERRQERREAWAQKREASARGAFDQARTMADAIPFGQPVLVGHYSEKRDRNYRSRIDATMSRGVQDTKMAEHHANRAGGIAHQLDTSVYSDDVDAIERLRDRIAGREARRDRIKAYNASCRKGTPDPSQLTARERDELESLRRVVAYQLSKGGGFPSYILSNLGATIRKDKERIADIERRAQQAAEAEDNGGVVVRPTGEYCTVTFAQKPERPILNALKAAGFRWAGGSWHGRTDAIPADLRETVDTISPARLKARGCVAPQSWRLSPRETPAVFQFDKRAELSLDKSAVDAARGTDPPPIKESPDPARHFRGQSCTARAPEKTFI